MSRSHLPRVVSNAKRSDEERLSAALVVLIYTAMLRVGVKLEHWKGEGINPIGLLSVTPAGPDRWETTRIPDTGVPNISLFFHGALSAVVELASPPEERGFRVQIRPDANLVAIGIRWGKGTQRFKLSFDEELANELVSIGGLSEAGEWIVSLSEEKKEELKTKIQAAVTPN